MFLETPEGVTHRDYVTRAWTEHPVKDVLVKMAATPALTRVATSAPYDRVGFADCIRRIVSICRLIEM